MLTSRDAITGYWDSEATAVDDLESLRLSDTDDYLFQLRPGYSAFVVETFLKGRVQFDGSDGRARLLVDNKPATEIRRPSQAFFGKQLVWLRAYADLRSDRLSEVQMQLGDALSFFGALHHLDNGRRSNTLMLLDIVRNFAIHIETPMKFFCRAARPIDYAPEVQPMIQTPDHSSFPSGHSLEAFAIAAVMHRLQTRQDPAEGIAGKRGPSLPFRLAHRIATNRTVAGVHFPVDSRIGAHVGCLIGDLVWSLARGEDFVPGNPDMGADDADFLLSEFDPKRSGTSQKIKPVSVLGEIWKKAEREWPVSKTSKDEGNSK